MRGNRKWVISYIVTLLILLALLILATRLDSPSEIISPPSLYGQNAEIQSAFEDVVGDTDISLQYPNQGEYRSAFVLYDLDGDEENEAIVFYSRKSDETTARMNILDFIDDEWTSVYDDVGYGGNILSVEFQDLNLDGSMELVCCWSLYGSDASKVMSVHSIKRTDDKVEGLVPLLNQPYSFASIGDADGDSKNEVFVAWLDLTDTDMPKAYASLFKCKEDGTISQIGQNVALDATISSYASIKIQNVDGVPVAFIDAYKGENSMITEIIWWDSEKKTLVAPFIDENSFTNIKTLRTPAIPSLDIDGDGKIEIPIARKADNDSKMMSLISWSSVEKGKLTPNAYSFVNSKYGYAYMIPKGKEKRLAATSVVDDSVITIYSAYDNKFENPYFSLAVKDYKDFDNSASHTFSVRHKDIVVYGSLTGGATSAGFKNPDIENSIVFFDDLK